MAIQEGMNMYDPPNSPSQKQELDAPCVTTHTWGPCTQVWSGEVLGSKTELALKDRWPVAGVRWKKGWWIRFVGDPSRSKMVLFFFQHHMLRADKFRRKRFTKTDCFLIESIFDVFFFCTPPIRLLRC